MDASALSTRSIALGFMDMMKQFLGAMREVFPECVRVMAYDAGFTLKTSGKTSEQLEELGMEAMREYHETMNPWYGRCTRRDESLLRENIEFLSELGMQAKWNAGMHPDTKATIWEYINKLNNSCCLLNWTHDILPPNIMSVITANATEMADKIKTGEMTMSDFNVMELSQKILGSVDPAELEQLSETLQRDGGVDISNMYSMLTNMSTDESVGAVDMSSLLRSILPAM